uniref:Minor histocompatibility antigen H13 n=1 Tax=Macrostomum lignano TaxID=282301 RepID=A0A1I8H1F8_9PLAT
MENATLNDTLNGTAGNATFTATTEGFLLAYSSLFTMAIVPIIIGSLQSVAANKLNKETGEVETMTSKDAAMFPLYASGALFGIYLFFKLISKEYINMLLAFYFFLLGVLALTHVLKPVYHRLVPASLPNRSFNIRILEFVSKLKPAAAGEAKEKEKQQTGEKAEQKQPASDELPPPEKRPLARLWLNLDFDLLDLANLAVSACVGLWYLATRHWLANNAFGLAFAINAIELLHLNKVATGAILLSGLFIYDVFWVFGTNVMVTVAKSFEAPIKLVFPQDLLEKGLAADKFAMLGLGDIVIPGIFVALLLRYDAARGRSGRPYFCCCLAAYCAGLLATIVVMHVFKHAQPALLYLVPCCLGAPLLLALARGELGCLLRYEDTDGAADSRTGAKKTD